MICALVTGVQTCALPISWNSGKTNPSPSGTVSPDGSHSSVTVMRFCVSVPVLSVHSAVAAPRASTADARRVSPPTCAMRHAPIAREIGRAHVLTPVTNAHLVCRLLIAKNPTNHFVIRLHQNDLSHLCFHLHTSQHRPSITHPHNLHSHT